MMIYFHVEERWEGKWSGWCIIKREFGHTQPMCVHGPNRLDFDSTMITKRLLKSEPNFQSSTFLYLVVEQEGAKV